MNSSGPNLEDRKVVGRKRRRRAEEDEDYLPDYDDDTSDDSDEEEEYLSGEDEEDEDYLPDYDDDTSDDSDEEEEYLSGEDEEDEDYLPGEEDEEEIKEEEVEEEKEGIDTGEVEVEENEDHSPDVIDEEEIEEEEGIGEEEEGIYTGEVEVITSPTTDRINVEPEPEDNHNNNSNSNLGSGESNGNDDICVICMNPYSQGVDHRFSDLHCGHPFGLSCIQRWIEGSEPGFAKKCSLKDIRKIYAPRLSNLVEKEKQEIVDGLQKEIDERDETIKQISEELKRTEDTLCDFKRKNEQQEHKIEELKMSLECNGGIKCQLCMSDNHDVVTCHGCQFINAKCIMPNCDGIQMLRRSTTAKNPNRVFLKCRCEHSQWMDEACKAADGPRGCYRCGEVGHWARDCPGASGRF
ncbi:hypothetical protein MKW98_013542 [Papaver atlanticum]|uniref:CCHC-type domain-containing protein n=1 Tax=Papaver atlanticum TaxID=357466 RepID=A0AAD4SV95_9MAGN|nr:hypothetical protein MKW98_013542 [Papaver atlanticum]